MGEPALHIAARLEQVAGPLLVEVIGAVIERRGRCRLGLCGGSTPAPTLRWLAAHLPASHYHGLWVTWVDERHGVEAAHRNEALARGAWLDAAPAPARVLAMPNTGSLEQAREDFEGAFLGDFGGALDVALLGAGPDGHIASLFPGHPALEARGAVIAVTDSPKPPPARLSLSLPVLQAVECAVLLARGGGKAAALAAALRGDGSLPLGRYDPDGAYHWIVDPEAAAALGGAHGGAQ